jgi:hypothetical protein
MGSSEMDEVSTTKSTEGDISIWCEFTFHGWSGLYMGFFTQHSPFECIICI